ncbi:MAG: hypothetical protein R6V03_05225 [Kiritimatiellia bacterium]
MKDVVAPIPHRPRVKLILKKYGDIIPAMDRDITDHCAEIDRCNQRGGRMLSIVDLMEAGTLNRDIAAYSLAAIGNGCSFMIGAMPGGAGKTTVMGALLNFVPCGVTLLPADGIESVERGLADTQRRCFICHEIGSGPYYAYLWGEALRRYFRLPEAGHILATNLHADTFEQARRQVRDENGVSSGAFRRMNLVYFLSVEGGFRRRRRVASIWESNGKDEHRPVFGNGTDDPLSKSRIVTSDMFRSAGKVIDNVTRSGARTIEEVRKTVIWA